MAQALMPITGTCETMCPVQEMQMREEHRILHYFEIEEGTHILQKPRADPKMIVKEFCRAAAGKKQPAAENLRPFCVLHKTLSHLICKIAIRRDKPDDYIYNFIFDRMRAVRQDMIIQQIHGKEGIRILEPIIQYLMYSSFRLCQETLPNFDPHINNTHIQECMKRLLVLYEEEDALCENKAYFVGMYLVHNLDNMEATTYGLSQKKFLGDDHTYRLCMSMQIAALHNNYIRIFKLLPLLSPLHLCALNRHIPQLQRLVLCRMSSGFNSSNLKFPLSLLSSLLFFDNTQHCTLFCQSHGISVFNGMVTFRKTSYRENYKLEPIPSLHIQAVLKSYSIPQLITSM